MIGSFAARALQQEDVEAHASYYVESIDTLDDLD